VDRSTNSNSLPTGTPRANRLTFSGRPSSAADSAWAVASPSARAQPPHQHKVSPTIPAGAFQGGLIGGGLHHAELADVALWVLAQRTHRALAEGVAAAAVAHLVGRGSQGQRESLCAATVMLQEVKGHALR